MNWIILEYETKRGERPVTEFIKQQRPQAVAKISHFIDLLIVYGSILAFPHAKKLVENIFELRIRGREELRILYGFKGKTIYLLHGFKKQTRKTPSKELEIAKQRFLSLT